MRIEDAKCIKQTAKAILVTAPDFGDDIKGRPVEVWIPQVAVHEDSEVYKEGTEGVLIVADWLAEERGWI